MKYLIFFLLSFDLAAQCKTEVDEFTHKFTIQSPLERIASEKGLSGVDYFIKSRFTNHNGYKYLTIYTQGLRIETIKQGEDVFIKFLDDSVMHLVIEETSISNYFSNGRTYNYLTFGLSEDQILKLKETPVTKIRVHYIDYVTTKISRKRIMQQIECVLNALPPDKPKK